MKYRQKYQKHSFKPGQLRRALDVAGMPEYEQVAPAQAQPGDRRMTPDECKRARVSYPHYVHRLTYQERLQIAQEERAQAC